MFYARSAGTRTTQGQVGSRERWCVHAHSTVTGQVAPDGSTQQGQWPGSLQGEIPLAADPAGWLLSITGGETLLAAGAIPGASESGPLVWPEWELTPGFW